MKDALLWGKSIYLRILRQPDADGRYPEWLNDPEVCRYNSHGRVTYTRAKALEYIAHTATGGDLIVFAIVDQATGRHVGNCSLQRINFWDGNAEIAILIGEKDTWGKGVGAEAWHLVMRFAFETLGLHRVYCGTHAENIGMQKVAKACGMREEGRLRDAIFKNDKYADQLLYGALNPRPTNVPPSAELVHDKLAQLRELKGK